MGKRVRRVFDLQKPVDRKIWSQETVKHWQKKFFPGQQTNLGIKKRQADLIQNFYKRVRSLVVGYSARIRDSSSLDTGRVREGCTELNNRVRTSMIHTGHREVQCERVCNQEKFWKRKKKLSELLGPESLWGSLTNSETGW